MPPGPDLRPRGAYLFVPAESPARRLALAPLLLLEAPYRLGASLHRALYRRGWCARERLPAQVVSVGNLAVGGSGKTPTASWLAGELVRRGRRVALLGRGVRGRRREPVSVVSDGSRLLLGPQEAGDEPVWLARHTPGVPVLAGRDRAALGRRALEAFGSEILILDDGFQHHRLARDVDLVCVDAAFGLGNGHVLPRGPLREPPRALRHADALIFTRAAAGQGLPVLPGAAAGVPRFALEMAPVRLRRIATQQELPLESLRGERVGVLAAVARPGPLLSTLASAGAAIAAQRWYPDHHLYTRAEVERLAPELRWITTAKDAVKLPPDWLEGRRVDVLEEEVRPAPGPGLVDWLLDRLGRAPEIRGAGAEALTGREKKDAAV